MINYLIYGGVALAFGLAGVFYYLRRRFGILGGKKVEEETPIEKDKTDEKYPPTEVRTYDAITRCVYNEVIKADVIKQVQADFGSLGRRWVHNGKQVYALRKAVDEGGAIKYSPVIVTQTLEDTPDSIFRIITQPQVPICCNVQEKTGWLQKYWHILLFAGVAVFLMWTLAAGK